MGVRRRCPARGGRRDARAELHPQLVGRSDNHRRHRRGARTTALQEAAVSWAAHELESIVLHKHLKATWRVSYMAILVGALLPDLTKLGAYGLKIGHLELVK